MLYIVHFLASLDGIGVLAYEGVKFPDERKLL